MASGARTGRVGEMEVLLCVAEARTFSAAGRALGLTPSAVSKLVTRVEERLGVPLFDRSSHGLSLTDEGTAYHRHCQHIVSSLDDVERTLASQNRAPLGRIRLAAPSSFCRHQLVPLLPRFLAAHPAVQVELTERDAVHDIGHHADVEIHVGPVHDESLHVRRLGTSRCHVVAAPAYLHAHDGAPATPDALSGHQCLRRLASDATGEWLFLVDGRVCASRAAGSVQSDTLDSIRDLALAGVGIAWLPDFVVAHDLRAGRLVPLLERYRTGHEAPVSTSFLGHRQLATRIRAFVDFLSRAIGRVPPWRFAES